MARRVASSGTAVSWIPSEAVELGPRGIFDLGIDAYDPPPPVPLRDLNGLHENGRFRTANVIEAWIDVDGRGRVVGWGQQGTTLVSSSELRLAGRGLTFAGVAFPDIERPPEVGIDRATFYRTAGGRTGLPAPRRVRRPPYLQLAAPPCWTTVALTLHADGRSSVTIAGASPFPRHWLYDADGSLVVKSGLVSFDEWWRDAFGHATPWGAEDASALVTPPVTATERVLSEALMAGSPQIRIVPEGDVLVEQGDPGQAVFLLLDGILVVERDGQAIAEVGPGAVLGEQALFAEGRRTSTLRAATRCRVAVRAGEHGRPGGTQRGRPRTRRRDHRHRVAATLAR